MHPEGRMIPPDLGVPWPGVRVPSGQPSEGGAGTLEDICSHSPAPLLLPEDFQGWASGFFQAHLAFGGTDLEAVEAASLQPPPGHVGRTPADDSSPISAAGALVLPEFLPPWKDRAAGTAV